MSTDYRDLVPGEVIKEDDEWWMGVTDKNHPGGHWDHWQKTHPLAVRMKYNPGTENGQHARHRRKIDDWSDSALRVTNKNMNKVRAKMFCESVKQMHYLGQEIEFHAQYSSSNLEDNSFAKATPSASLKMVVDNPSVHGFFVPGKCYYLDFSPA